MLYKRQFSDVTIAENRLYSGLLHERNTRIKSYGRSNHLGDILNWGPTPSHRQRWLPDHLRHGGLVIPFFDLDGKHLLCRVRPNSPRVFDGHVVKYEQPRFEPLRAYFPIRSRPQLVEPEGDILIHESEFKALTTDQLNHTSIGLCGMWGWKANNRLLPDLERIVWKGRRVYIIFDFEGKPTTRQLRDLSARGLARELRQRGAKEVCFVDVPPPWGYVASPESVAKQGIDDYLNHVYDTQGHTPAYALTTLLEQATPIVTKVTVVLGVDEHRVNKECEAALVDATGIYQRGGVLSEVTIIDKPPDKPGLLVRQEGSAEIRDLPAPILREKLTALVDCLRLSGGKKNDHGSTRAAPIPKHVVPTILARRSWNSVPHLVGVLCHPILLPGGTLLADNGYQPESGLMLVTSPGLVVDVPDPPTRQDAIAAAKYLCRLVVDFPFKEPCDRSAFIAALLTPLCRYAFHGPAPLFLVDGNRAGVGKGLLADVVCLTILGRAASTATYTNDVAEMRKLIT
jgi:hypothetical protein